MKKVILFIAISMMAISARAEGELNLSAALPSIGNEFDVEEDAGPPEVTAGAFARRSVGSASAFIVYSVGPNPNQTNAWNAYRSNSMQGLPARTAVGTGAGAFAPLADNQIAAPWMITLTPFNNDGFRTHAGLVVVSPSAPFRLWDVSFVVRSSDPSNALKFEGTLSGQKHSTTRRGLNYGFDGIRGTADDIPITSGEGNQLIHELVFIGVANPFVANSPAVVDQVNQYIDQNRPFSMTVEYTIGTLTRVSKTLNFQAAGQPPQPQAPIISMTATPSVISPSGTTTVAWTIQNATSASSPNFGTILLSDSRTVALSQTGTFTINAVGPGGSSSQSVTVTVVPSPPSGFTLQPTVTLAPFGEVAVNTRLRLGIAVVNPATNTAPSGPITAMIQFNVGRGWEDMTPDGSSMNLNPGQRFDGEHIIIPKSADTQTYRFRIVARTSDGRVWESNETPSVRVVGGPVTQPSPPISGTTLALVVVQNALGTYQVERTMTPANPLSWAAVPNSTFTSTTSSTVVVQVPESPATATQFYRARKIQ